MTDAPRTATPWRRDPAQLEADLTRWARSARGARACVADVRLPASGMANDTVMFSVDGEALVARLAPAPGSPYPTFPTYDLEFQRRVMDLVRARTTVPVPEVVHLERSSAWLGAPFLVTRAVEGAVASDNPPYLLDPGGWFLSGTPEQWERLEVSTIDLLVRLHRIGDDGEVTAFLHADEPGTTALARQLAAHRRYYDWARDGRTVPVLERAFDVLTRTLPANDRSVVNWGDARPGNIIYRDFEPVAALDWEMAGMGPPEVDVAWVTFFQRLFAGMAAQYGLTVPAMFGREETAATYEQRSGDTLDDLGWYEALAGLRLGIILMRMTLRSAAFGLQELPADANDMIMFVPLLERMLGDL
jgi:aminoglycoside phosphotransferase (APT) family kinase protein